MAIDEARVPKGERAAVKRLTLLLPSIDLKANRRLGQHWGANHREKRDYKTACCLLLKGVEPWGGKYPVQVTATAYLGKRQRCDPSDLGTWLKPALDAIVEAGILAGDDASHINPFVARVRRDWDNPRVEFEIEVLRG